MTGDLNTTFRASPHIFAAKPPPYKPSPHGEGSVSRIPLSPSNLRPFGAPPSKGRREYPREPLPLEGAAERSEAGLASFFAAKPPPLYLSHWGRGTAQRHSGALVYRLLETIPLALFHTASTLSAPSEHLPLEGKAVCRGYHFPPPTSAPSGHLLPKEGGSIHASPFPWKGLPSAARRGWLLFLRRSRLLSPEP